MHRELVDYIRNAQQTGLDPAEIERQLLRAGWSPADIQEAFGGEGRTDTPRDNEHTSTKMPVVGIFIFSLSAVLIGFTLGALMAYQQQLKVSRQSTLYSSTTKEKSRPSASSAVTPQVTPTPPTPQIPHLPPEPAGTFISRSTCEKISDASLRGSCYFELAIGEQKESLCNTINDQPMLYLCRAAVVMQKNDLARCDEFSNAEIRHDCLLVIYTRLAKITRDISLCNNILDELRSSCVTQVAIATNDLSTCQRVEDNSDKSSCIEGVAKARKDANLCGMISNTVIFAPSVSSCYQQLALVTGDTTLCQKSYELSKDHRYWCHRQYAVQKADVKICEAIPEQLNREQCFEEVAETIGNPTICGLISENSRQLKYDCDQSSQQSAERLKLCEVLDTVEARDECFILLAKTRMQPALCNHLSSTQRVGDCHDVLSRPWYFP